MKRGPLFVSMLCLATVAARAEDLLAVYDRALTNDPQIREAEATRKASLESKPQALSNLLPQASIAASRERDWSDGTGFTQFVFGANQPITSPTGGPSVTNTDSVRLTIRQNLFSWANWVALKDANRQVAQAEANYLVARQSLAQRVAQLYFAVLAAQDVVDANEAARVAFQSQLDQAEKRFEVGLIAITDVQEARAARDSAAANVIVAKRALAGAEEQLRATVGERYSSLNKPSDTMPLLTPSPANEEDWVKLSLDQNATLTGSRLAADIARDQVQTQFSGHLPTIDLVAGRSYTNSDGTRLVQGTTIPTDNASEGYGKSLALQVTIPLFSGGATQSRVRQAQYNWIAAKERLERTSRDTERQARDSYLGVISGISQVQSLKQALDSSETALKATQAGYEVGTRTSIEVLTSRQQLIQAQTNYSQARYNYLNSIIQLRLAAGDLDRRTLEEMNRWMTQPVKSSGREPTPPLPPSPALPSAP
jgi:outer membrane protein